MTANDPVTLLRREVEAVATGIAGTLPSEPSLDPPDRPEHGDYATNAAMLVASSGGRQPREVADDLAAQLVERLGEPVAVVRGSPTNLKITAPEDLPLAEAILAANLA